MTYLKLFSIKYNKKRFTIFLAEDGHKAFLEIDKNGKYIYPLFEDFMVLNFIYNNFQNSEIQAKRKKYTLKENIRYLLKTTVFSAYVILAANTIATGIEMINNQYEYFDDTSKLDELLGYESISKEDVFEAIDKNDSLPLDYKIAAKELTKAIIEKSPEADLRIFYERIKNKEVQEFDTLEELNDFYHQIGGSANTVVGFNNVQENKIYTTVEKCYSTLCHELSHSINSYYLETENKMFLRYNQRGNFIHESITDSIGRLVVGYPNNSFENVMTRFFSSQIDFDFGDYTNYGLTAYIEKLKNAFPELDIDYIIAFVDTYIDSLGSSEKLEILQEDKKEFLEDLFYMCTRNIADVQDDIYAPFSLFADVLTKFSSTELLEEYYERYNDALLNCGKKVITKEEVLISTKMYQNIDGILYGNGEVFLVEKEKNENEYRFDFYRRGKEGKREKIDSTSITFVEKKINEEWIKYECFKNPTLIGTEAFDQNLIIDYSLLEPKFYKQTNLTWQEKPIATCQGLFGVSIQIGMDVETNAIAYRLSDDETILLDTSSNLINLSKKVPLTTYLASNDWSQTMFLEKILNLNYLKAFLLRHESLLGNVTLEKDGTIKVSPSQVQVVIHQGEYSEIYNLKDYKVFVRDWEKEIFLSEILSYYQLNPNNENQYNFNLNDISRLCTYYVHDVQKLENYKR